MSKLKNFKSQKRKHTRKQKQNKSKQKKNEYKTSKTKQKRTNKKRTFWENMSLKSNQGKIPEFTMVNILNSVKRSYKINKAPEKQLKKGKGNTKQTNKTKKRKK